MISFDLRKIRKIMGKCYIKKILTEGKKKVLELEVGLEFQAKEKT